jgi:protein O-GlcNAc transferase
MDLEGMSFADYPRALLAVRRSQMLAEAGELEQALVALDDVEPRYRVPRLLATRASLLRDLCRVDEAREDLARAAEESRAREPGFADGLLLRRALALPPIPASRYQIAADRARIRIELEQLAARGLTISRSADLPPSFGDFYLAYHAARDDREIREATARILRASCPWLRYTADHVGVAGGRLPGRLRIGFLSSHFRDHTISLLYRGLIQKLDAARFERTVFFVDGITDEVGRSIAERVEHAVPIGRDLDAARRAITVAGLDVLVFPDLGMDQFTYLLAFSRLAPRQCVIWGHPVTTGIDTVDVFLASPALVPTGEEAQYSERIVRLPDPNVCYARPEGAEAIAERAMLDPAGLRTELGLPVMQPLLVCPQSAFKMHPDFDRVLAELLRRLPAARCVMSKPKYAAWRQRLLWRLEEAGVETARLRFVPALPRRRYLALFACADVVLDPIGFGGGNTGLEALAVGAPVVTQPSRLLRGRLTASWIGALDGGEGGVLSDALVASDAAGYMARVERLARDPEHRRQIGARILAAAPRLFDRDAVVRGFADFVEAG